MAIYLQVGIIDRMNTQPQPVADGGSAGPRTAQRILEVASDLLERHGYHAFSFRDIAARVGIRSASIHYYYPSKGDLAEAVLAQARNDFQARLADIQARIPGARQRLARFADLFAREDGRGERLCPFCMIAAARGAVPDPVRAQLRAFWDGAEQWLARVLAAGRARGELAFSGEPRDAAVALLAALEGAMVAARATEDAQRFALVRRWLLAALGAHDPVPAGAPVRDADSEHRGLHHAAS